MKILCWKLTDVEFDFSYHEYECGQKKFDCGVAA